MSTKAIATSLAAARLAFGLGMLVAPGQVTRGWIGGDAFRPGAQIMVRGLGARDIALGAGALLALRDEGNPGPWLAGGALADVGDFIGTVAARDHVPSGRWLALMAMITGSAVGNSALAAALND